VNLKCTEDANVTSGEGYKIVAQLAILITIVHISPDDRKHQRQVLRGLVGKKATYPAREVANKLPEPAAGTGKLLCTSGA
jgi:hypothetical protein